MKTVITACAAVLAMTFPAAAAGMAAAPQQLVDLETAWSKAMTQRDTAAISTIVADDWIGQNDSGKPENKTAYLAEIKSGDMSAASMTNHDVHVRLLHNVALVQGADDEKSSYNGKDTSGTYTWMDVFEMRGGKWVAVASQVTKVSPRK
ncbi:MAG: nuclear transport factor 2 family protein [Rhizomicrobium sp.]